MSDNKKDFEILISDMPDWFEEGIKRLEELDERNKNGECSSDDE